MATAAADDAGQALGAAGERQRALGDLRQGEAGVVGGDAEVAGEGELEAGAEAAPWTAATTGQGEVGEAAEGVEGQINGWVRRAFPPHPDSRGEG